jgi:hypothetical protein
MDDRTAMTLTALTIDGIDELLTYADAIGHVVKAAPSSRSVGCTTDGPPNPVKYSLPLHRAADTRPEGCACVHHQLA